MTSNLKQIYKHKDKFDIYNKAKYHFNPNPIYQVNRFITNIDEDLTKNLRTNLEDIIIINDYMGSSISEYDNESNILYCNRRDGDIFGLLQVASNDRTKPNIGIVIENDIGYGLNNGLTEVFKNDIDYTGFCYPLEATIAKTLLMIDSKLVTYSYFNNDGENLKNLSNSMKALMIYTDLYHDNTIKLANLYNRNFRANMNKYRNIEQNKTLDLIRSKIYKLELENINNVYLIFEYLIKVIENSNLEELEKQDLYIRLNNEFRQIFSNDKLEYLDETPNELEKHIYVKKK